jgi:hypothetical protein
MVRTSVVVYIYIRTECGREGNGTGEGGYWNAITIKTGMRGVTTTRNQN